MMMLFIYGWMAPLLGSESGFLGLAAAVVCVCVWVCVCGCEYVVGGLGFTLRNE